MDFLTGAGVALVTPFKIDGSIDFPGLEQLIENQIAGGMDYLVSLGTTGETATLSKKEKQEIWDFTVKVARNRIPLVAGIGGNHTQELVEALKTTNLEGYQAILSVSPYYNKPTQEGIYRHYEALAMASPLPLILYNVPGRTASFMEPQTTLRLAQDFENIIATKEASANFDCFTEIMRDKAAYFKLISGDDALTLPMLALGASGIISVVGNAYPKAVSTLTKLGLEGNFEKARQIHSALFLITQLCFVEGNPAGIKCILQNQGVIDSDKVRLPLVEVSGKTKDRIFSAMDALKIFE